MDIHEGLGDERCNDAPMHPRDLAITTFRPEMGSRVKQDAFALR